MVTEYIETKSLAKCREKLEDVIRLFYSESSRYFDDILDDAVYDNLFCSVARILLKEKRGWTQTASVRAFKSWSFMIMTVIFPRQSVTGQLTGFRVQESWILRERSQNAKFLTLRQGVGVSSPT